MPRRRPGRVDDATRQALLADAVAELGKPCFRIRDGHLAEPVEGARFTQSVLGFLATVDAVADRVVSQPIMNVWNGAVSAPAVRGTGFRFGVGAG